MTCAEVERVYEAQVLGVPDAHDIDRLSRGIMLEGATLGVLGGELAIVAGWGTACLLLTLRIFRWQ